MSVLITGSNGLIGSAAVEHFDSIGQRVIGVDNNQRREFFGPSGDTSWNLQRLQAITINFDHRQIDIRDRTAIDEVFRSERFNAVVHCAAQPSHDLAARIPFDDFDVNAVGTLNLLEATRRHCPEAAFIFMSTNKVYGDAPNELPMRELETRYDYADPAKHEGIDETCRIDQTLHSLFGASKVAADVMAQEYGRYFNMNVGIFRGGCLTGPSHSAVELHGFLSYLVKCTVRGHPYTVFGYQGKQVRDNIHSADVISAFDCFLHDPKPGEVYNLGGGRANSVSMLEAISAIEEISGRKLRWRYDDTARRGDHQCYISDLGKLRRDYPSWRMQHSLEEILTEMVKAEVTRL
ncbi:MAG: NAD-dependent epimerase/dehydratase family protein [Acidimicrobiales bacterium]